LPVESVSEARTLFHRHILDGDFLRRPIGGACAEASHAYNDRVPGLLIRRVPSLLDLAGVDAKYGTPEEAKKLIEQMREEY